MGEPEPLIIFSDVSLSHCEKLQDRSSAAIIAGERIDMIDDRSVAKSVALVAASLVGLFLVGCDQGGVRSADDRFERPEPATQSFDDYMREHRLRLYEQCMGHHLRSCEKLHESQGLYEVDDIPGDYLPYLRDRYAMMCRDGIRDAAPTLAFC